MKKIAWAFFFSSCILLANQVTIYNSDFSLVRTTIELDLKKGVQSYFYNDIPNSIEPNSVMLSSDDAKVEIFSQNYEYDLANTNSILQKYLGKELEIETEEGLQFSGTLQFHDETMIGLVHKDTKELTLIKTDQISHISLESLPGNFFLKPTLHWQLSSNKSRKTSVDFSYLCSDISWEATYNTVFHEKKGKLDIKAWVTIDNKSGKQYDDIKLKLVAGELNKIINHNKFRYQFIDENVTRLATGSASPSFAEKEFHDFHLYTLDSNVTIQNNQTKQLELFSPKTTNASSFYEYITNQQKIKSYIKFTNSKKSGLGIPLPMGVVKVYKLDEEDDQLEFIGEDEIDHTAKDEEVKILTGNAFDIIAETKTINQDRQGKNIWIKDMEVVLKNKSSATKTIHIKHNLNGEWKILDSSEQFTKENARTIQFVVTLQSNEKKIISWKQKITN